MSQIPSSRPHGVNFSTEDIKRVKTCEEGVVVGLKRDGTFDELKNHLLQRAEQMPDFVSLMNTWSQLIDDSVRETAHREGMTAHQMTDKSVKATVVRKFLTDHEDSAEKRKFDLIIRRITHTLLNSADLTATVQERCTRSAYESVGLTPPSTSAIVHLDDQGQMLPDDEEHNGGNSNNGEVVVEEMQCDDMEISDEDNLAVDHVVHTPPQVSSPDVIEEEVLSVHSIKSPDGVREEEEEGEEEADELNQPQPVSEEEGTKTEREEEVPQISPTSASPVVKIEGAPESPDPASQSSVLVPVSPSPSPPPRQHSEDKPPIAELDALTAAAIKSEGNPDHQGEAVKVEDSDTTQPTRKTSSGVEFDTAIDDLIEAAIEQRPVTRGSSSSSLTPASSPSKATKRKSAPKKPPGRPRGRPAKGGRKK